ncbi:MAG: type II toxin-antitoxin system prevent-host-death family antitoxin [Micrococcales bacterium]|nr:type II toxin-antitoxin system prevent-host-death family antitoxin [Micrococcales bacterium]
MSLQVNVQQAKNDLSKLLAAAERGEEVVIARAGQPVVRLTPVPAPPGRRLGFVGAPPLSASFFEPLSDSDLGLWDTQP